MSRYFSFTQRPCCCSAACVKIALQRRGYLVDELVVAKALGTRVTSKDACDCKGLSVNDNDPGLNIDEFESKSAQAYFAQFGLVAKVYKTSQITDFKEFIENNLADCDVIVNIHHAPFNNGKNWGHFVLLDEFKDGAVTICDPAIDAPKCWQTSLDLLKTAMSAECDGKERGIVVINAVQV